MKYTPPYRFDTGSIFEYSEEHSAYIYISKKLTATTQELAGYRADNASHEREYDAWRVAQNKAEPDNYRLIARNEKERLDYQYFTNLSDAAVAEDRLKCMGYKVQMQNYFNNQWI